MGKQILNGNLGKMMLNGVVYGNTRNFEPVVLSSKWQTHADPIDYTYTVQEEGQYIAFGMYGDNDNHYFAEQSITTTGTIVYDYLSQVGISVRRTRFVVINCEVGDTITIQLCNYAANSYRYTCAGIFKVDVGKIKSIAQSWDVSEPDKTSNLVTTTNLDNNKIYLALTINCGQYNNVAYSETTGKFLITEQKYTNYFDIAIIYSYGAQITQYSRGTTAGIARNIGFVLTTV